MDILEKYKNTLLLFLKVDFGLLAVVGSIITILKFQRNEIFQFISEIKYLVITLIAIICFSFLLQIIIVLTAGVIYEKRKEIKNIILFVRYSLLSIAMVHIGIFSLIGVSIVDYSELNILLSQEESIYNHTRKNVFDFYSSNYRLPNSIDEIYNVYPSLKQEVSISNVNLEYNIKDELSYEIVLESSYGKRVYQPSILRVYTPELYNSKPIDDSIISFYKINKRTPYSLAELKTLNKKTAILIDEYLRYGLYYWAADSLTYELKYPGADNIINTKDDIVSKRIIELVHK